MAARVSIIIPCYQQARFLPEAVESALEQTVPPLEIIIVNDGSTDETREVAAGLVAWQPGRVRLVEQANQGLSMARQAGLEAAEGDWLVLLDADDRLTPNMLADSLKALAAQPTADGVVGHVWRVAEDGRTILNELRHSPIPAWPGVLEHNPFGACMSVLLRAESVRRVGGLGLPGVRACEDWDLYARMIRSGMRFVSSEAFVACYRQHSGVLSRNVALMLREKLALLGRALSDDPRLSGPGLAPAPPISRDLYERLKRAAVFHSLGVGFGLGLDPAEVRTFTEELSVRELDRQACADQFRYGLQHALLPGGGGRRVALDGATRLRLETLLTCLGEQGLERPALRALEKDLRRELKDPFRKRSLGRAARRLWRLLWSTAR